MGFFRKKKNVFSYILKTTTLSLSYSEKYSRIIMTLPAADVLLVFSVCLLAFISSALEMESYRKLIES